MKCPKCKYVSDEFDYDKNEWIKGDEGGFYSLPIEMGRSMIWDEETKTLYGCPNCGTVFINV